MGPFPAWVIEATFLADENYGLRTGHGRNWVSPGPALQKGNARTAGAFLSICQAALATNSTWPPLARVAKHFDSLLRLSGIVRIHQPRRASQISECGGAGTGCGWCVPYLKRYFEEARAGTITGAENITPAEYEEMRADYIRQGKGTPPPGAIPLPDK